MTPDTINGLFELFASVFVLNHCRALYREKLVRGISLISIVFFLMWGFWNLFYYPHLGQSMSFYFGILVCIANAIWISMIVYYRLLEKRAKPNQ